MNRNQSWKQPVVTTLRRSLAGAALAAGIALTACGGGGGGGSATVASGASGNARPQCTNPPAKLTGVQNGTMQVTVLYKTYDGKAINPVDGVTVMIDDGGPSAVTDACGYATFTGLAPGPHDVFVFGPAGNHVIAQTDQAHVEVPVYTSDNPGLPLFVKGNINGNSTIAEFHFGNGRLEADFVAAGPQGYNVTLRGGDTVGGAVTGHLIFRKWFSDGTNITTTNAFDAGQVSLIASDMLGVFNRTDNVVNVTFPTPDPAPNLTVSYTGTPSPNVPGIYRMYVFPSFNRAMQAIPYHGRTNYELVMDPVAPFALDMYSLPTDQLYMVTIGAATNTGALGDLYPGDSWTVVQPVPAGGAVNDQSSFTAECNTIEGQTGTTFTFTPATGQVSYHKLELDIRVGSNGAYGDVFWHIWLPPTATSFTLPANLPAGVSLPTPVAGYPDKARLACVDAGGMSYAQFANGSGSLFGKRIEEYKLYANYYPY